MEQKYRNHFREHLDPEGKPVDFKRLCARALRYGRGLPFGLCQRGLKVSLSTLGGIEYRSSHGSLTEEARFRAGIAPAEKDWHTTLWSKIL